MLFSLLASTLAFAATSSAAPSANPGRAFAYVHSCVYSAVLPIPRVGPSGIYTQVNFIGTQMVYSSLTIPVNATIYSEIGPVDTNSRWIDSEVTHTTRVDGDDYYFSGTFQPTKKYPRPQLVLWGPKGTADPAKQVHLPTSQPSIIYEGNDWQVDYCLDKWPVSYVKTLAQARGYQPLRVEYCTLDAQGNRNPACPDFRSLTYKYSSLPDTI